MPNTRRSNRRRNTRRSNNRRVRRNTRRSRRVRSNTRRSRRVRSNTRRSNTRRNRKKRGNMDIDVGDVVPDLGGFDTNDMLDQWEALVAEKRLAWMRITKEVMNTKGVKQQKLIDDIAEMVAKRIS